MIKDRIKKGLVALLSGMAAVLVLSVSVAPVFAVTAEETNANENVAVIGTSTGLGEGVQVNDYKVAIDVKSDSTVDIAETISVEFTADGVKEFYRNIPRPVEQVAAVMVTCDGNNALDYSITASENTTLVTCFGGTEKGNAWTYELVYSFKVESFEAGRELVFSIVDESLGDASAEITLPKALVDYETSADSVLSTSLSLDGKKLTVSANEDEAVAVNAITVKITLPDMELVEDAKGILESSFVSMWLPMMPTVLVLVVLIACAIMMVAV